MKIKAKEFINKYLFGELYIKIAFFVATVLYQVPIFMEFMDKLFYLILLWCAAFMVKEFVCKGTYFNNKIYYFSYLSVLLFVISFVINGMHIVDLKVLFYILTQLFLFFGNRSDKTHEQSEKEFTVLAKAIVITSAVVSALSLGLYLIDFCKVYTTESTPQIFFLGVHPNSALYGFIGNSNQHAWLCVISVAFSLFLYKVKKSKRLIANIILQIVIIHLNQSRGGEIGLYVLIFLIAADELIKFIKRKTTFKRTSMFFGKAAALFVATLVLTTGANYVNNFVRNTDIAILPNQNELLESKDDEIENIEHRTEEEKRRTTSARVEMYITGAKMIKENPIFGVGNYQLDEKARSYMGEESLMSQEGFATNFHNILIQTAVVGGIPQLIMFLIIVGAGVFVFLRSYFKGTMSPKFVYLGFLLAALFVMNMVETEIFMSRNLSSTVFWIVLGYLMHLYSEGKPKYLTRIDNFKNKLIRKKG